MPSSFTSVRSTKMIFASMETCGVFLSRLWISVSMRATTEGTSVTMIEFAPPYATTCPRFGVASACSVEATESARA